MELNQIPQNPNNWGNVADLLNENSGKIEAETAKLNNVTTKFKGYFSSSTALSAKWPSPLVGDVAWVGATYPGVVYRCNVAGTWLATTDVPSVATVNLSEYYKLSDVLDKLKLNVSTAQTLTNIGEMAWNPETETAELKISNEVTMSIGQELFVKAKNTETTSILNGTPVYISGAQGGLKQIKKASNLTDIAEKTIGIATQDIAASASGIITTMGEVHGLNTSAFAEGALIWLGANGALTTTKPVDAPYHIIIGVCTRSHATEGSIFVSVKESYRAQIDQLRSDLNKALYDVSSHNDGAVFESISTLLGSANLSTLIPTSVRHGGMIIRFIQGSVPNSDNKYVQYRLMSDSFSTTIANWQGVDDEPTAESKNLVESGGVTKALFELYKDGIIFEGDAQESFFDNIFEDAVTYTVTSLNSINCSFAFKDANGNVIEVHYLEPNQSCTFTFNIHNCATFGGYTSGDVHYKLRIKVSSFQKLNSDINIIAQDSFEKGTINEYGKNDTYKELSRARSLGIRNSGNVSISIKTPQQVSQTASFIIFYYDAKGTYLNSEGWKNEAIIPAHSYYRLLLSLDPSASEEHTDSLSAILSAFSINPVDEGIEVLSNNWKALFIRGTTGQDGVVNTYWMNTSRVCTAKKIKTDKDIFVRYKSGYYDFRLWSSDGSTLVYEKNWWDGEVTNDNFIPAGSVFTMNITPDREAGQDDYYTLDQIFACVSLENVICTNSVSIPKTILQCRNVDDSRFPPYTKYYIQAAIKNQYDRVRVNVRKTIDGVFWCCHDDTINTEARNIDGTQISETIQTEGHTYAELSAYDWGIKYGPLYAGLKPPKFEDVCKFCSYFNIPLTIEPSTGMSEQDINTMFTLLETYGLVKDLIIITSTGSNWSEMNIWKQKSKYISFFVGGTYAQLSSWAETINNYKTWYNCIFIMIYPFGEHANSNLRMLCSENDWLIYDSAIMSKWDLMTYGFNRGISLLEANNVYMVKTNIQNIADNNI